MSPPASPHWVPFQDAIHGVMCEWDVLNEAVTGGWAGDSRKSEAAREKMIDDLLANYAERWLLGKDVSIGMVDDFFVGTMDDLFNCDLASGISYPVAKLCCRLYDECRAGKLTGANVIAERTLARRMEAMSVPSSQSANAEVESNSDDKMEEAPKVDADGWETVPVRRKGKGRKKKH